VSIIDPSSSLSRAQARTAPCLRCSRATQLAKFPPKRSTSFVTFTCERHVATIASARTPLSRTSLPFLKFPESRRYGNVRAQAGSLSAIARPIPASARDQRTFSFQRLFSASLTYLFRYACHRNSSLAGHFFVTDSSYSGHRVAKASPGCAELCAKGVAMVSSDSSLEPHRFVQRFSPNCYNVTACDCLPAFLIIQNF